MDDFKGSLAELWWCWRALLVKKWRWLRRADRAGFRTLEW
jgi:hypothetical protein